MLQVAVKTAAVDRLTDAAKYTGSSVRTKDVSCIYRLSVHVNRFLALNSGCGLMRAGAVAELMEGETNLTVPVTFKDMTIKTRTIKVTEEKRKQSTIYSLSFLHF